MKESEATSSLRKENNKMKVLQLFTGSFIQLNERKRAIKIQWLKKFRDPAFKDELWVNLTIAPFVLSLIFLIGMHIVQIFSWN